MAITRLAAAGYADTRGAGLVASLRNAGKRLPTLLGLAAVLALLAWLALWLWPHLIRWLTQDSWQLVAEAAALGFGVVLLASTLLALLGAALGLAAPLLAPAIVIDDADAFDALSRAFAYATQRLLRLLGYVALAAVLGVLLGALVEGVVEATMSITFAAFPPLDPNEPVGSPAANRLMGHWTALFGLAARGVYPAYWFVATTGVYLLLRRDVDGQPLEDRAADHSVEAA